MHRETHGRPFLRQAIHDIDELILLARAQGPRFAEATTASRDALARLNRLQAAYTRASAAGNADEAAVLQAELHELQDELQLDVMRVGAAGSSLLGALEPGRLWQIVRGLCGSFAEYAAAAAAHGTARVGVRFDLSERLARAIYAYVAPAVRDRVVPTLGEYSTAVEQARRDPRFERYLDLALGAMCASAPIFSPLAPKAIRCEALFS